MKNYIVLSLLFSLTSLFGVDSEYARGNNQQAPHQPAGSRPSNATHGRRFRSTRRPAGESFAQATTAEDIVEEELRLEHEATYGTRPSSPVRSHSRGSSDRNQSCSVSPQVSPHVASAQFSPHATALRSLASQPLSVIEEDEEYSEEDDEEEKKN